MMQHLFLQYHLFSKDRLPFPVGFTQRIVCYSGIAKSYPGLYVDVINLPLRFYRNLLQKLVFHCRLCIVIKFPYKRHANARRDRSESPKHNFL